LIGKILIPYDGSKHSDRAVKQIIEFTKLLSKQPTVILLHVIPEIHLPASYDYGMRISYVKSAYEYRKEIYQELKMASLEMLSKKKDEFDAPKRSKVITEVITGNIVKQILEIAASENVDLVALGSAGLGGMSKLKALGSISRRVSEMAKCPVLIVH
jgi:nucleotide-binding universal stress UspA family protein